MILWKHLVANGVTVAEQILDLFPLQHLPPQIPLDSNEEQKIVHLKAIQESLIVQKSRATSEGESKQTNRPGELYRRYRTVEDLPDSSKAFYEIAGKNS